MSECPAEAWITFKIDSARREHSLLYDVWTGELPPKHFEALPRSKVTTGITESDYILALTTDSPGSMAKGGLLPSVRFIRFARLAVLVADLSTIAFVALL